MKLANISIGSTLKFYGFIIGFLTVGYLYNSISKQRSFVFKLNTYKKEDLSPYEYDLVNYNKYGICFMNRFIGFVNTSNKTSKLTKDLYTVNVAQGAKLAKQVYPEVANITDIQKDIHASWNISTLQSALIDMAAKSQDKKYVKAALATDVIYNSKGTPLHLKQSLAYVHGKAFSEAKEYLEGKTDVKEAIEPPVVYLNQDRDIEPGTRRKSVSTLKSTRNLRVAKDAAQNIKYKQS